MGAETMQERPGDEAGSVVSDVHGKQQQAPCQVCQLQPHKYRCPGCQLQTCSLACSQQHKQQSGCSGKRDKLAFVPMAQFNDKLLMSDYRWLEEVSRADDNARRLRPPTPRRELPQHLSSLVHQARLRGVRLLIMPPGMQRRQSNSTRYDYRNRKLTWRVEWRFPAAAAAAAAAGAPGSGTAAQLAAGSAAAADASVQPSSTSQPSAAAPSSSSSSVSIIDGRVDEEALLCDMLGRHLQYQPGAGGQALLLRQHRQAGVDALTVLMRKERCPANAIRYHQLDLQQSLKSQLAGKTVIEFPTLLVLLPAEAAAYSIITAEEQRAELAAHRQGHAHRQQQPHWPPPPPPPPRKPARQTEQEAGGAAQQINDGQQQQQQQQQPEVDSSEPPAKRQCTGSTDAAAAAAAVSGQQEAPQGQGPQQEQQLTQQQQQATDLPVEGQQQGQASHEEQQQGQQQPTYYYYDPADGVDEDAADLLAGLEEEDDEQPQQPQQPPVQVGQAAAAAAGSGPVLGGEEGRAAMMELLGQYDEHEIDLDE